MFLLIITHPEIDMDIGGYNGGIVFHGWRVMLIIKKALDPHCIFRPISHVQLSTTVPLCMQISTKRWPIDCFQCWRRDKSAVNLCEYCLFGPFLCNTKLLSQLAIGRLSHQFSQIVLIVIVSQGRVEDSLISSLSITIIFYLDPAASFTPFRQNSNPNPHSLLCLWSSQDSIFLINLNHSWLIQVKMATFDHHFTLSPKCWNVLVLSSLTWCQTDSIVSGFF